MPERLFEKKSTLPVDRETAFAWHDRQGAFERLTPPFEPVTLVEQTGGIRDGARVVLRIKNGPIALRWHARHEGYDPPAAFVDVQERGPFASWRHEHRFEESGRDRCLMHDRVRYRAPLGHLGAWVGGGLIRKKLERMFAYRHATLAADLADHQAFGAGPRQTVLVTGASGLIGTQLCAFLSTGGHRVRRLVREGSAVDAASGRFAWAPDRDEIDAGAFEGVDAVVHLAGERVFALGWSTSKRRRILESRTRGTRLVASMCAERGVRTLVSASAVGYYGDTGSDAVDEQAPLGEGFLAEVCGAWEAALEPARERGVRTVAARIGVVLTPAGGALGIMRPVFALGLGGKVGSGRQGFPWISIDDAVRALHWCVMRDDVHGAVNLAAPEGIDQRTFARTLGSVMRRPVVLPSPAWLLSLLGGEMARETMLKSAYVRPRSLVDSGFEFRDGRARAALERLLGRGSV